MQNTFDLQHLKTAEHKLESTACKSVLEQQVKGKKTKNSKNKLCYLRWRMHLCLKSGLMQKRALYQDELSAKTTIRTKY